MMLAVGLVFPATAQLMVPCDAFQRDQIGAWTATAPVTVDTNIGLLEIMPGHRVGLGVANILDARCR